MDSFSHRGKSSSGGGYSPSSIFLYCPHCIPAGRHSLAFPREPAASTGKLNNSQWPVGTGRDRNLMMAALQGCGSKPGMSVTPSKTWNEQAVQTPCVFHQCKKRANQPVMWNHRGLGSIHVIIFHYSTKETVKAWSPFQTDLIFSSIENGSSDTLFAHL